jgi:hypothetical protein
MMKRVTCNLTIGDYTFVGVNNLIVESGWEQPTDTCKITLPRKAEWLSQPLATGANPILQRGMEVVVSLGYDGVNETIYKGYIVDISAKIPLELTCEDEFWLLKKGEFTKSYRSVTLSQLLADIFKGRNIKYEVVAERKLGAFKISKATPAKVLNYLRENYHVKFFFRNGVFYAGLVAVAKLQKTHEFFFEPTEKSKEFQYITEHDLIFKRKEDVRMKLKGIIKQDKGKDKTVEVGDDDGEVRTFNYTVGQSIADVKKELALHLERLKYDGYRGTMTVFGIPQVQHGDLVRLSDPTYPERNGRYLVKKVTRNFGIQGSRQTLEIEQKYD